jgi:hypothetical protein
VVWIAVKDLLELHRCTVRRLAQVFDRDVLDGDIDLVGGGGQEGFERPFLPAGFDQAVSQTAV